MAQVVGADLALEAVDGQRVRDGHDAGIVDQHVGPAHPVGEPAHRRQILQVEFADLDLAGHRPRGRLALAGVAHGHDDGGPRRASSRAVTAPNPLWAPVMTTVRCANDGKSAAVQPVMAANTNRRGRRAPDGYFAATTKPWMIASMPVDSAAA